MQLKDWILLFVPILSNGIIIWIFQAKFKIYYEHKENYKKLQEQIFTSYIDEINKCIKANRNMFDVLINTDDNNRLEQSIYDLRDNIRNLYFYFETYKVILSTNDKVVEEFNRLWDRYKYWIENWENNNIQISFLKDCEEMLQNIMNECLKYIYGIKK